MCLLHSGFFDLFHKRRRRPEEESGGEKKLEKMIACILICCAVGKEGRSFTILCHCVCVACTYRCKKEAFYAKNKFL